MGCKKVEIPLDRKRKIEAAGVDGSCRFCPDGQGIYYVEDTLTGEVYFLCEKHKNYEPEGELS